MTSREDDSLPLVVIVHGAMDRSGSFGRMARRLSEVSLLRYDRRGYGRSEPGRAVALATHVEDLLNLVEGREAVVFGHSFGGTVALAAAAEPSSTFRSLVVYESPVPSVAPVVPFSHAPDEDPAEVAERFMRSMIGDRIWQRLPAGTKAARRHEGAALLADLASVAGPARSIDVGSVRVPVMVAVGASSGRAAADRAACLAAELPAGELVVVPGAGHGVHLSDPAAAAGLVMAAVGAGEVA